MRLLSLEFVTLFNAIDFTDEFHSSIGGLLGSMYAHAELTEYGSRHVGSTVRMYILLSTEFVSRNYVWVKFIIWFM